MKKMTYFVMALALVLGLSQCKKEQPDTPQNGQVRITLNVENGGNNGSRVNVDPTTSPMVTFEKGDKILVGYNGAYVGTLTHNGNQFEGSINATESGNQPLYFYFVGNKQGTLEDGATSCTVSISDQTNELPVLSFSESDRDFDGEGSYSASLHNQCALVKFPLAQAAGSIKIGGMKNEATINFASPSITPTGSTGEVRLYSRSATEKWAILLPQNEITTNVVIGGENYPVTVPAIAANALDESISTIENTTAIIDLSTVTSEITVGDGTILTGTLDGFDNAYYPFKISIADGATVTLNGVTINGVESYSYWDDWEWEWVHYYYYWAGLTCLGDATIILEGENTVTGFYGDYPGIQAGPTGTTLTIKGTGSLTASNHGTGAGIGGGYAMACGNIEIQGGVITANSAYNGAGIGGGNEASCGDITISGGTVTATCGDGGAGIGGGRQGSCGNISITGGTVTATCGNYAPGIGSAYGNNASCGNISIAGGTVEATGGMNAAGIGSGYYQSSCGDITIYATVTSVKATKGSGAPYSIGAGKNATSCGTVTIGGNETGNISDSPYYYPSQP